MYLFINSPAEGSGPDVAAYSSGPAGTCADFVPGSVKDYNCIAYNYGWNAAKGAMSYASSSGANSAMWWLDVEGPQPPVCKSTTPFIQQGAFWSCMRSYNAETVAGAIAELRSAKVTAGIYSTAQQYGLITGNYVPPAPAIPLWVAGAPWTIPPYPAGTTVPAGYPGAGSPLPGLSALAPWCQGQYDFAGGTPSILQETPGPINVPYDPDYAC